LRDPEGGRVIPGEGSLMFLKPYERRKSGKGHTYWAVVESVCTARGSPENVARPLVAAILVTARFCAPSSELHIEDTWYRRTARDDLMGVPVEKVHTDRLYAGLDVLLPRKEALGKHLRNRLGYLFDPEYDLLLYDMTSTYFEGQCAINPLAQRGYSRDSQPDCTHVCIGLAVTTDGIPLGYEVFAGNFNDATTVQEIIEAMERKDRRAQSRVGDGSRYGKRSRSESDVPAQSRKVVQRRHTQSHAPSV
jgi:hypothetical protein